MLDFKFADIGEGIHEGQILKWMVQVGDTVKEGQTLCLVETDKVNAEIPSPIDGKIVKIFPQVGDTIQVGDVLVQIADENENVSKTANVQELSDNTNELTKENDNESAGVIGEIEVSSEVIESSEETPKKVLATPVARKLAKDLGVDINKIKGSGIQGRIMKEDIYRASETKTEQINKPQIEVPKLEYKEEVEKIKISKLRKTIAKNMTLSKTIIPHSTTLDEFDVTKLVQFRKEHKKKALDRNINLTYLPFIIKAVVLALKSYPVVNSSFDMDSEELIMKHYYNIGIAVDTDDGLIVPVIKNADKLGIFDIAKELQEIIEKTRNRTIALEKLQGGTFTITNYGAGGSAFGIPIIRYPEVAILGVGMITKKPVVENEDIVIRDLLPISLSYDHRVIDGGDAGRFLKVLREYLNDPMLLLLS
ncbi:MAG TPA: dihydrolipoamide acetyltransferase family protein [Haloplasmataceae bacterium]